MPLEPQAASVGFRAAPQDLKLDRHTMTRRVCRAYLDHVSFVEDPAYEGARVLSVRSSEPDDVIQPEVEERDATPLLREWSDDEVLRWAADRLNKLAEKS